ncbi:hypothetical protein Bca52824_084061 [Brassica carinata]|uniref:K-box domain-containing protein n=1 Tax=Brassica carinata TaxID=52824 RepID=A0A8X7PLX2_BRACI|nr:hypothetical protein Bca52824_084061 [Brassica carinata]
MVRGKIQLKRIENPVHRQVTFCKRRTGLLKRLRSSLCSVTPRLVLTMEGVIDKYLKCTGGHRGSSSATFTSREQFQPPNLDPKDEVNVLKKEVEMLQKGISYMFGGGDGAMNLEELLLLEKHLEYWISQIRSAKMEIMLQEIQSLRNKEGVLENANKYLLDKIEENNNSILDANFATVETNYSYIPLAMPSEIFQF